MPAASMCHFKKPVYQFSKKVEEDKLKEESKKFYDEQVVSIVDMQT